MKEMVCVLLSSYNGEKYIREQLDSILAQEGVEVRLLIRDDGSTDGTRGILEEYEKTGRYITVIYGENVGVIRSFFQLIEAAAEVPDEKVQYVAFADQDDVWLPDKLARAVGLLKEREQMGQCGEVPLVYCSTRQSVDEQLHPLKTVIRYQNVRTEFGNALVENMCSGCTCVINRELLQLLKGRWPKFTVMHDFWIYLVGTCFGEVLYDRESRILYRQHGSNELGAASSLFENYRRRVKYFKKHRGQLTRQAQEFLRIYGDEMPREKRELAEELVKVKMNRAARRKLLKERKVFRQRRGDTFVMRIILRLGAL